jgi:hypothetical protein
MEWLEEKLLALDFLEQVLLFGVQKSCGQT